MNYLSAATKRVIRNSFVIKLNTAERHRHLLIVMVVEDRKWGMII
jgi:hypothetical protein